MTHLSSLHSLHCHTLPAFWNITSRKIQLVANTWESPFYGTRPQMYPELISTAQNSMYATIFFCTSTSRYALITPSHVFVDIDADGLMFWIEVIGVVVVVFVEEIPAATAGFPIEVVGVVVGVFVEEVAATTAGTIGKNDKVLCFLRNCWLSCANSGLVMVPFRSFSSSSAFLRTCSLLVWPSVFIC